MQTIVEEFFVVKWKTIEHVLISFFLGALVGLEREKARLSRPLQREEKEFPGVRSFGITCMFGALISELAFLSLEKELPEIFLYVSLAGLFLFTIILGFYIAYRFFILKVSGITTILALSFTFLIGVLVGTNLILEATAISVFITFILAIKPGIEKFVKGFSYSELLSALEVGIVVFVFSPLLLTDIYDPFFHIFNFRMLYVFFALTLVLSLLSYIAVKAVGSKALTYFAFFGGLVNSEATVINLVRLGAESGEKVKERITAGILIANTSMILRNFILSSSLASVSGGELSINVISHLLLGMLPAILIGYLIALFHGIRLKGEERLTLESPLSFTVAAKAAIVYASIFILIKIFSDFIGSTGTIISAIVGGFINAGATILSIFTLTAINYQNLDVLEASVLLATFSAIMNKILFARMGGADPDFVRRIIAYLVALGAPCFLAAIIILFF